MEPKRNILIDYLVSNGKITLLSNLTNETGAILFYRSIDNDEDSRSYNWKQFTMNGYYYKYYIGVSRVNSFKINFITHYAYGQITFMKLLEVEPFNKEFKKLCLWNLDTIAE